MLIDNYGITEAIVTLIVFLIRVVYQFKTCSVLEKNFFKKIFIDISFFTTISEIASQNASLTNGTVPVHHGLKQFDSGT